MSLGGASIGWSEGVPSSTSNAGLGEQDLRSIKTSVRNALDSEHVFPSTGGTAGAHRPGSAVAFYAASSAISSTDTDGRLYVTSDTSQLWHVGSAATILLGGRYATLAAPEIRRTPSGGASTTTSKVTQGFAMEIGEACVVNSSFATTITLQTTFVIGVALATPINESSQLSAMVTPTGILSGSNSVTFHRNYVDSALQSTGTTNFNYVVVGIAAL